MCVCVCVFAKSLQSSPTLCHPMDCGAPDSSVHGILQARILEWVALPSSRDMSLYFCLKPLNIQHLRGTLSINWTLSDNDMSV